MHVHVRIVFVLLFYNEMALLKVDRIFNEYANTPNSVKTKTSELDKTEILGC